MTRGPASSDTLGGVWLVCGAMWLAQAAGAAAQTPTSAPGGDPQARAAYQRMIAAFRRAQTVSYRVQCQWRQEGQAGHHRGAYHAWLKKPNYFRIQAFSDSRLAGTLVGDGRDLWVWWPGVRPVFDLPDLEDEQLRADSYMTKPAPIDGHSIGHEVPWIGTATILDPSIFHGYTDSLQPYVSGYAFIGRERLDSFECDVIEVSFLQGQRVWRLWIARRDHLPRRVHEFVRLAESIIRDEQWLEVSVDQPLADELFVWRPPPGWRKWSPPDPGSALLQPGRRAPDFQLPCADGRTRRLSDYGDKAVWLVFWRYG